MLSHGSVKSGGTACILVTQPYSPCTILPPSPLPPPSQIIGALVQMQLDAPLWAQVLQEAVLLLPYSSDDALAACLSFVLKAAAECQQLGPAVSAQCSPQLQSGGGEGDEFCCSANAVVSSSSGAGGTPPEGTPFLAFFVLFMCT